MIAAGSVGRRRDGRGAWRRSVRGSGVPSIVAARAALGRSGARLLAVVLYVTNFAWIALNNVIAASACARLVGGRASERYWALGLGLLATAVVAAGRVRWAGPIASRSR